MQTRMTVLFLVTACLAASTGGAANYFTDATMSLQEEDGTLHVDVRVSHLLKQHGKPVEQLVAALRITRPAGVYDVGSSRPVRFMYSRYSSPNCLSIIFSSP